MRIVLQRVRSAEVWIDSKIHFKIQTGLVLLLGLAQEDDEKSIVSLVHKTLRLKIFPSLNRNASQNLSPTDSSESSSRSLLSIEELQGEILVVSQFTLYADCSKGRKPSFSKAMPSELAKILYETFVEELKKQSQSVSVRVQTGQFQSDMDLKLNNWGPFTLILES